MRVLRLIISAFLFFLVITVGGFFILREALLYWGSNNIKNSLRELSLAQNRGSYGSQCSALGASTVTGEQLVSYQLRFISSTEYLVEAVCEGFAFDPILIAQGSLPQFVTKVPGTSGFLMSFEQTGIELEVFAQEITQMSNTTGFDFAFLGKKRTMVAEHGVIIKDATLNYASSGPVTVCSGYGYKCCNEITHFGIGDRIIGLPDCQESCYSACATRPVLLSFNTNPLIDPRTRTVTIISGTPVEFTFVADRGDATTLNGILDYGDGVKASISGLAGQISHTYECMSSSCEYLASVTLEDNWGAKSAPLEISKVKIIVTR